MFKKVVEFFFEVEEEVVETDLEQEEVIVKTEKKKVRLEEAERPVKKVQEKKDSSLIKSMNPEIETKTRVEEVKTPVIEKPDPVKTETPIPETSSKKPEFGIVFSEAKDVKPKSEQIVPVKKTSEPANYEFSPVISPMFGSTNEKQVQKKKIADVKVVRKETEKSKINTIISPIYGDKNRNQTVYDKEAFSTDLVIEEEIPAEHYSLDDLLNPIQAEIVTQQDQPVESVLTDSESFDFEGEQFSLFDEDSEL